MDRRTAGRAGWLALAAGLWIWAGSGMALGAEPAAQASESRFILRYEELEERIKAENPQTEMERIPYESRIAALEEAKADLVETRKFLRSEASDREDAGDTAGADHYRGQADTLEDAVKDIEKQLRQAQGVSQRLELSRLEDRMAWTAQSLMGTYNTLKLDHMAAQAEAELAKCQHEQAKHRAAVGGASEKEVQEALLLAQDRENQAAALGAEMERTRAELLLLAGFAPEEAVDIGTLPIPDASRLDAMQPKTDKRKALGNNYELREQRHASFSGTNKELHARQRDIAQSEEEMYARLVSLYQAALESRSLSQAASEGMAAGEAAWRAASHKWDLGMLSRQEYLKARQEYLRRAAEKGKADIQLQLAMDEYAWALEGLMG